MYTYKADFTGGIVVKNLPNIEDTGDPRSGPGWEDPLEEDMATPFGWEIDPGKSHRHRRLLGYSPRGRKESDITE